MEWVKRSLYEQVRERAMAEHDRQQRLRRLLSRIASITPREGQWDPGWRLLQNEASDLLGASSIAA